MVALEPNQTKYTIFGYFEQKSKYPLQLNNKKNPKLVPSSFKAYFKGEVTKAKIMLFGNSKGVFAQQT